MASILVSTRNDRYTEPRRVAWRGIGSSRLSRRQEILHNHRFEGCLPKVYSKSLWMNATNQVWALSIDN